jgi:hypothetical protein
MRSSASGEMSQFLKFGSIRRRFLFTGARVAFEESATQSPAVVRDFGTGGHDDVHDLQLSDGRG